MAKAKKRKPTAGPQNAAALPTSDQIRPEQNVARAGPSSERNEVGADSGSQGQSTGSRAHEEPNEVSKAQPVPRKRRHEDAPETAQTPSKKQNIRKLAPPRPFPTVPTSVSPTGPRSAHVEGKNRICISRKTDLGAYLRRCKDVVLKDGYKTLYLHAMGAAIPHLARLAVSLPSILPYDSSDILTEVRTGTTEVQDEIIPDDEDEDISLRTRGKSTMSVTIKIEGGDDESASRTTTRKKRGKGKASTAQSGRKEKTGGNKPQPKQLVFTESDLEDDNS